MHYADSLVVTGAGYDYKKSVLEEIGKKVSGPFGLKTFAVSDYTFDFKQLFGKDAFNALGMAALANVVEDSKPGSEIILCVMNYPILTPDAGFADGYSVRRVRGLPEGRHWRTSFVSTYPEHMSPKLPDEDFIERASKIGIHEVGHYFDLNHHNGYVETKNGLRCPMSFPTTSADEETALAVDSQDFNFCDWCEEKLDFVSRMRVTA